MNNKHKILTFGVALMLAAGVSSCNDDWSEEQYSHYISFKAPLDTEGTSVGVTTVYIPFTRSGEDGQPLYGENGLSHYDLPVIVAGSTVNPADVTVNIVHSDTLTNLNLERFSENRKAIWYNDMSDYATYPSSITIPAGQDIALLRVKFDFRNLDLADKYVLPLTIDDPMRNPLKHFATAMLRVLPYTTYSGQYMATNLKYYIVSGGVVDNEPGAMNTVQLYATDEDEAFFYAGTFSEDNELRKHFKIYAKFIPFEEGGTRGTVRLYTDQEDMNFIENDVATFNILETPDEVQSYIVRKTVIISGIDYTFSDTYSAPGSSIDYKVTGTMTMERKLNTQKPEEDQIEF
ncbi:MAG: DUF4973 domain-containing protein [Muribaculaceae bacterium]|nr:DUF4973 domain-containing protein [Muribaculaceae bacterium]